jgi:HlyD family secretion protein
VSDSTVVLRNGDTLKVKTGLKDFKKIEILEGLTINDEIIRP